MKLQTMKVLSDDEIKKIHDATLDILADCGVKVLSKRMLEMLASKGLEVDYDTQIVKMKRSVVEDALSNIPPTFDVYSRDGDFAFTLGDGVPKVAAGHNAVFWVDHNTGETRPSKVKDVEEFAAVCHHLDEIDMIGIPVMPQDVDNPNSTLLYGVRACIENSTKPIYFSTDKSDVNHECIELLKAAFALDMRDKAYGISQLSPTSPLFWEGSVIDAIEDTVLQGVPLAILPEPNAGVSSPYTLAGLLTMNNAECISGLVIAQLIKPGAKVMYANSWTTTDMRTGSALVGSIETTVCRIAAAQLARFYKTPSHTTAPNSDNHAHDEQNSWEKTYSQFCALAAGHDLVVNCGMFATGMTCSHEQLVMDEEISAMARRLIAGVEVTDDTIAADLIKNVGPAGENYMMQEHTMDRLRSDEFYVPKLAVRGSYGTWEANGKKDCYMLAKEYVSELAPKPVPQLEAHKKNRLKEIVESFKG